MPQKREPYIAFDNNENNLQNKTIIEALEKQLKIDIEIKTDYIERELKVKQYSFYFRAGERAFKFIEDNQVGSTVLYAIEDNGDKIGLVFLKGRLLKLQEYYFDAVDFDDIFFENEE